MKGMGGMEFIKYLESKTRTHLAEVSKRLSQSGDNPGREGRKEMFYLTTYTTHFIYSYNVSDIWIGTTQLRKGKEMFYLTTYTTHFIYSYNVSDIWIGTTQLSKGKEMFYLTTYTTHFIYSYNVSDI